jgi:hypothetical protein
MRMISLRDGQAADHVICDHSAGVADDVGVPLLETEDAGRIEAGVHARHHRHRRKWQLSLGGRRGVALVVCQ